MESDKIRNVIESYDRWVEIEHELEHPTRPFTDSETRIKYSPLNNGEWIVGERGNGIFRHNDPEVQEVLEFYGVEGVEYKDGIPDFFPFALDVVQVDALDNDRDTNFRNFKDQLATIGSFKGDNTTIHECIDRRTMMEVDRLIHEKYPHIGTIGDFKEGIRQAEEAFVKTISRVAQINGAEYDELVKEKPEVFLEISEIPDVFNSAVSQDFEESLLSHLDDSEDWENLDEIDDLNVL